MNEQIYYDEDGLMVNLAHGGDGGPLETSTPLDDTMQKKANEPALDPTGLDVDVQKFLEESMRLVYEGQVNTFIPKSLINETAYSQLNEAAQGIADAKAIVFCSKLRDIKGLMDISGGEQMYAKPTYQIQQLVKELKAHKEEFETQYGDIFLI